MERKAVHLEQEPSCRDFDSTSTIFLRCSVDSKSTHTEYEWIDYSLSVFRKLQDFHQINIDDYMDSIRGRETLRLLLHKKNAVLLPLPHDNRFRLQIITKSQMKVFLEMLPKYYHHVKKYKNTLLIKYYGLHIVKPQGGQKVRFIVTGNVLRSDVCIHKHFILRCSPHSHHMHKPGPEEDLNMSFHLCTSLRHKFLKQLKHDCNFLEEVGITHYNFLLGMHICSSPFEAVLQAPHSSQNSSGSDDYNKSSGGPELEHSHADQDLTSDNDSSSKSSSLAGTEVKLGVKTAARAIGFRKKESGLASSHTTGKEQLNNVILFFGIIDILQGHSLLRHMEHLFRSLHSDSPSISGINPRAYSNRFQEYLCKVFPENDSDANVL